MTRRTVPLGLIVGIVGTFLMNIDIIIPVFAKSVLGMEEAGYSQLLAAFGLGALLGALTMVLLVINKNDIFKVDKSTQSA